MDGRLFLAYGALAAERAGEDGRDVTKREPFCNGEPERTVGIGSGEIGRPFDWGGLDLERGVDEPFVCAINGPESLIVATDLTERRSLLLWMRAIERS